MYEGESLRNKTAHLHGAPKSNSMPTDRERSVHVRTPPSYHSCAPGLASLRQFLPVKTTLPKITKLKPRESLL